MTGYTKLFSSLVTSSIWSEDDQTRIVWVTMLALADRHGEVHASVPGLAKVAGVSIEACNAAINKFLAPDPYSRTPDLDGKRIERIDGGWELINHAKYRALASRDDAKDKAADRKRRQRNRDESVTHRDMSRSVTPCHAPVTQDLHIAEAEAEADKLKNTHSLKDNADPSDRSGRSAPPVVPATGSPWHLALGVSMPERLRTTECLAAAKMWLQHKKECRQAYKATGLAAAVGKWAAEFSPDEFVEAVNNSIAQNYKGIFAPRSVNHASRYSHQPLPMTPDDEGF